MESQENNEEINRNEYLNGNKMLLHKLNTTSPSNMSEIPSTNLLPRNTINLLTYNFFLRPPPIKTNEDDYKEERLNDFPRFFPDFDIICFQEMFGSFHNRKHKMIQNAAESGFFYHLSSQAPSFFSKYLIDGGLLILSRFPIIETKAISYDYGVMSDSLSMKGALYAKIKIKDNFLCLFSTHLQASYFDAGDKLWNFTISTRVQQTESLINFIYDTICTLNQSERDKCKFILCGDFNIDAYNNEDMIDKYKLPKNEINEYEVFMNKLSMLGKVVDIMKNKYKKHPFTFGVNEDEFDKVLTGKEDFNSHQALDYIFEIIPDYSLPIYEQINLSDHSTTAEADALLSDNAQTKQIEVLYETANVEHFLVKDRPYQQLSDHFGVSVSLSYKAS